MARTKVKLAWITNEAARKSSLKKRRLSLIKKVQELSILCGVESICIVYSPTEPESPPVVWPDEADRVLAKFLAMPAYERTKRMTNQESYLRDQITKLETRRKDHLKAMNELEMAWLMDEVVYGKGVGGLGLPGLDCLSLLLKEKLGEIRDKARKKPRQGRPAKRVKKEGASTTSFLSVGNGVVSGQGSVSGNGPVVGDLCDVAAVGLLGGFESGGGGDDGGGFGGDFLVQAYDDNNVWSCDGVFPPTE